MTSRVRMDLRAVLGSAAATMSEALGGARVSALLLRGRPWEVEVVHRDGVPEEVCAALAGEGGRAVLGAARRAGLPLRIAAEDLPRSAAEVRAALRDAGAIGLGLLPLTGERGSVGALVALLDHEPPTPPTGGAAWQVVSGAVASLQIVATARALRSVLEETDDDGASIHGVMTVDGDGRVLAAEGWVPPLVEWRGEPIGVPLATLPGGCALERLPIGRGGLRWEEHRCGAEGGPEMRAEVASVRAGHDPQDGGCRVVLFREVDRARTDDPEGIVLALAIRLAHALDPVVRVATLSPPEAASALPMAAQALRAWIHAETEGIPAMVARVLDRHRPVGRRSGEINALLKEVLTERARDLETERVRVFTVLHPDLPRIEVDSLAVRSALCTLVDLARASLRPAGGSLTVRSWTGDGWVYASVSDDGAGRAGHDEERIGAPLFQPRSEPDDGEIRGVGARVARLGGRLTVESRPGLWSRNTVMLPAQERRAQTVEPTGRRAHPERPRSGQGGEPSAGGADGLAVLVVDDNSALRSVLRRYLERRGHRVTEAADGAEGLGCIQAGRFDRVIVDIHMPGTGGPEFYEGLERIAPSMCERTIFMTGGFLEGETERFLLTSGRPAVRKPFDLSELTRTVETGR